jgi:hypothetical protein
VPLSDALLSYLFFPFKQTARLDRVLSCYGLLFSYPHATDDCIRMHWLAFFFFLLNTHASLDRVLACYFFFIFLSIMLDGRALIYEYIFGMHPYRLVTDLSRVYSLRNSYIF